MVLLDIMLKDVSFNEMITDLGQFVLGSNDEHAVESETTIKFYIFAILFSQQLFYITHKIICQYLTTNNISTELLSELKHTSEPIIKEIIGFM